MAKKATAAKSPPANGAAKKPKQGYLEGMEPPKVKEIEDAADELAEVRRQRMALTDTETNLSDRLLLLMHKHNLKVYEYDGKRVEIAALEKIKVRKAKDDAGGEA